jgi:hypothetical protein
MSTQTFAGTTEEEWEALEDEQRYSGGQYRGLVFFAPARFSRERLAPLGQEAVVVGVAIWILAYEHEGQPVSCRDMRMFACGLGLREPIDYPTTLARLEQAGLIRVDGHQIVPLFYAEEKATMKAWAEAKKPGTEGDYRWAPSFLGEEFGFTFPFPSDLEQLSEQGAPNPEEDRPSLIPPSAPSTSVFDYPSEPASTERANQ